MLQIRMSADNKLNGVNHSETAIPTLSTLNVLIKELQFLCMLKVWYCIVLLLTMKLLVIDVKDASSQRICELCHITANKQTKNVGKINLNYESSDPHPLIFYHSWKRAFRKFE